MQIQNLTEADLLPMMEVTMAPPWAMAREDMAAARRTWLEAVSDINSEKKCDFYS